MSGLLRTGGGNNDMTAQIKPGIKELSDETGAPAAIEDVCDNRGPAVKGRGVGCRL